ncbi:TraM recognition domain-containing protein [Hymenobacter sp. YC55]|uniref:TraM recognition domain-containing protein n=1 Tax=Hymenobacter sp. YC55 TaxID=3034019 RepID=UPI0023F91A69|nr:TraM recognition domain-containing protein [Hymenobacter sp. YC55]MDF7815455.1 TraM recognition domain-containing protein [Hymenobacter sp. YC55]
MATPIPIAKPNSSGIGGLIALIVLLALLGGEYYLLTTRDSLLHPTPEMVAQASQAKAAEAAAKAALAKAEKSKKGKDPQAAGSPTAPPPGQPQPLDVSAMFGQSAEGGPGMMEKAMAMVNEYEEMGVGLGIRFVMILACVGLMFLQKPPAPKVGAQRRYARNPKTIVAPMQMLGVLLAFSAIGLLGVGSATGAVLSYGYPLAAALCLGSGFIGGMLKASTVPVEGRLMAEKIKRDTDYGIVLKVEGNRYVNVPNPFRGSLVLGGAGAGKTYSVGEPFLEQFTQKGMCGIIYDFKFPVLAGAAQKALLYAQPAHKKLMEQYEHNKKNNIRNKDGDIEGLRKAIRHRVVNFLDMERTEKVNPLRPQDMPVIAYAKEYAKTILTNLSPGGAKSGDNFFTKSSEAYLTGIIWYYRNNYPALCTIPHTVATAVSDDYTHVLHMLSEDDDCKEIVQSLITAIKTGAEKQIAGVVSSLQVDMADLATPQISWVMAPDEDPRLGEDAEGFSLNLNDPNNPTLLTIGNDPTLARTFSPVISCVIAVALKLMNQQHKHPSFVLIDEGATIYVPGLETIPATARSNRVAMLYMTQDMAQLIDAYGKDKATVLVSNLNNQFFGKINSAETARLISDMVGKEETEMVSVSTGQSMGGTGGSNKGQSVSIQEKQVFRMQDAYTLRQGEFVGQTVETPQSFFMGLMEREVEPGSYPIEKFTHFAAAKGVVDSRIRSKVEKRATLMKAEKDKDAAEQLRKTEERAAARATAKAAERTVLITESKLTPPARQDMKPLLTAPVPEAKTADTAKDIPNISTTYLAVGESQDEPGDETAEAKERADWDWESEDVNGPSQEPSYKPSAAEQLALEQRAAHSRHARERTQRVPDAANNANWQSESQRHEAAEKLAAEQAEERQRERTTQIKERPSGSILADMIAENHRRIRREVAQAIENSGENSLSKEGLARAAQAAKNKANSVGQSPY